MFRGKIFSVGQCFLTRFPHARKQRNGFPVLFGTRDEHDTKFLLQSDKLVIGPHLLLSPASTVVKPAEKEFAHHPNPIQERRNALNRIVSRYSVFGRTMA